jgi:hypothetical protein
MYHLQNIVNDIVTEIKDRHTLLGTDQARIYATMLKIMLQATRQERFPEVESNPLLQTLTQDVSALISHINLSLHSKVAESSLYLENAFGFLEKVKSSSKYLYIVLCDALSLAEFMFITSTFSDLIKVNNALCAVNPSGKTATFKYLAQEYLGMKIHDPLEEVTLRNVAENLRVKLGASGCQLFRNIDVFIHFGREIQSFEDMSGELFKIVNKLCDKITNWRDNDYNVLVLADHGYDVLKSINLWTLTHSWDKDRLCASPIVPVLLVG